MQNNYTPLRWNSLVHLRLGHMALSHVARLFIFTDKTPHLILEINGFPQYDDKDESDIK